MQFKPVFSRVKYRLKRVVLLLGSQISSLNMRNGNVNCALCHSIREAQHGYWTHCSPVHFFNTQSYKRVSLINNLSLVPLHIIWSPSTKSHSVWASKHLGNNAVF